jgi:hypothetical protein
MIKRYTGASFADVGLRKRWNGSAWVNLTFGRRWNGSAWVDLWNDSGGSGGSGSASGTLVSKVSSTVARPTVNYAATYAATRNGTALTVNLTFAAWLNSSSSHLGSGIKLTVFARMNGGAWVSAVIKQGNSSWSGTAKHSASLTLSGNVAGNAVTVDFYVSRAGSSYGGSAGKLGSASSPKSYRFSMS